MVLFINDKQLTLEKLTAEQLALLKDIRIFLNLTYHQMAPEYGRVLGEITEKQKLCLQSVVNW